MSNDKRRLWIALLTLGSLALTLWPQPYHASSRPSRRQICDEVTEAIVEAVARGELSSSRANQIIKNCNNIYALGSDQ